MTTPARPVRSSRSPRRLRVRLPPLLLALLPGAAFAQSADGFHATPSLTWQSGDHRVDLGVALRVRTEYWDAFSDDEDWYTGIRSRIRAQYAYGSANTSLADYWFDSKIVIPGDDVRRIRETYFSSDDGLLTMGLATRGPGFCTESVVRAEWELARELNIPITVHVGMGRLAGRFGMIKQLGDYGLLGPDTTYIHCSYLSEEEWRLLADSGGTVSLAPQVELQMGHGWVPVNKSLEYGLRPSFSIDVVTTVPGDMFTQIRAAFASERARVNEVFWERNEPAEGHLTARQMLEMATVNGAHVAQLESRTGSLTPGKQADVVLISATDINVAPIHDAAAAVTLSADVSNVDTVLIAGKVHKRDGKLTADVDHARRLVGEAKDRLLAQVAAKKDG